MADYPIPSTIPQVIGTTRISDDGTVLDRAESGKPRLRQYFTQVRYRFDVLPLRTTTLTRLLHLLSRSQATAWCTRAVTHKYLTKHHYPELTDGMCVFN